MSEILSKQYIGLHMKHPLFLSDINETWIFLIDFRKITKYQIWWTPYKWETSCSVRADGQTDRYDEANSCFSELGESAPPPKKKFSLLLTECIYVSRTLLRPNTFYSINFSYNGNGVCLLRGTSWLCKRAFFFQTFLVMYFFSHPLFSKPGPLLLLNNGKSCITGPGVDSASNRNEYQEYFLRVKAAGP